MIVVAGGMIRSGSTFLFNVIREVLSLQGPVEVVSANSIAELVYSRSTDEHFILKTHAPDEAVLSRIKDGEMPCVCTIRNPEDAISSWMHTFGFPIEDGIEAVRNWLFWYVAVKDRVLTIGFDQIEREPMAAITQVVDFIDNPIDPGLARSLGEKYSKSALKKRYDSLEKTDETVDIGFSYYDKETFFHRRHISNLHVGDGGGALLPHQVIKIRNELREYLERDDLAGFLHR